MTDPLGLVSGAAGAGGVFSRAPAAIDPADPGAPSFKDVLLQNINQVNKLQQEASTAMQDLATGKRSDLEGVMLATNKADTAFRMLLAVRNKVQQAYEEVKQMRV
jgi:flagellar hook-basal body complex protein FliE